MSIAVLFPGQGAHHPDMGDLVERARPELARALERAVGERPFARCGEGTHIVQPALFCASVVGLDAVRRSGIEADVFAGHSLGEIAALVAADALDIDEGLALVVERGRLSAAAAQDQGDGGMVAILKGDRTIVQSIASDAGVALANDNSSRQLVLSGPRERLAHATCAAEALGLVAVPLAVEGAFHHPAMAGVAAAFRGRLDRVTFREPDRPTYSGVTAAPFVDCPRQLAASLTETVRWREVLLALHARGVRTFVDAGPGKVLAGLVKHTFDDVEILTSARLAVPA
jgi:[acyl-carrier-protein] S-malonyltransferase